MEYFFANKGLNPIIQKESEARALEDARQILQGQRERPELKQVRGKNGYLLMRRSWSPPSGIAIRGLVYICHGFTEHMVIMTIFEHQAF